MPIGPSPSGISTGVVRSDLGGHLRMRYREQNWIADRILPRLEVTEIADEFLRVPVAADTQLPSSINRAEDGTYRRVDSTLEADSYKTVDKGVEQRVDDRQRERYKDQIALEIDASNRAQDIVLLTHEKEVRDLVHDTGTWTGAANFVSVTNEWDDPVAKIAADINFGAEEIRKKCGATKGMLEIAMGYYTANQIMLNEDFRAAVKIDSQPLGAAIQPNLIALYFGIAQVHVGHAVRNSANTGLAANVVEIWDNEYAFLYLPHNAFTTAGGYGLGRTFTYVDDGGAFSVEQYRDDKARSDIFRARHDVHAKLFGTEFGFLFGNVRT